MKKTYRRAAIKMTTGDFPRYFFVNDGTKTPGQRRFYTGDHSSRKAMWSRDPRQALVYAHALFALGDIAALQRGELPEGRRGVVGREPTLDDVIGPDEGE